MAVKVRRGEPIRRCLACNTCINKMRGGARIGCVVNGAAGRETMFIAPQAPHGERIAVIGAGPASLTYALLVAEGNGVTLFEKKPQAGGALRFGGQGAAVPRSRGRRAEFCTLHCRPGAQACEAKGVKFRLATDLTAAPALLTPFDCVVIATGAKYASGLRHLPIGCSTATLRERQELRGSLNRRQCGIGFISKCAAAPPRGWAIWRAPTSASS